MAKMAKDTQLIVVYLAQGRAPVEIAVHVSGEGPAQDEPLIDPTTLDDDVSSPTIVSNATTPPRQVIISEIPWGPYDPGKHDTYIPSSNGPIGF